MFLFNHLWTVLVEALLSDTYSARRAPCILLNLLLCLATVVCSFQWPLEMEINKQLKLLFAKNITIKIMSQCHHSRVKLVLYFVEINEN